MPLEHCEAGTDCSLTKAPHKNRITKCDGWSLEKYRDFENICQGNLI